MTWYKGKFLKERMPIAIDTSLVASGSVQFEITIPTYWDDFWENVRSDGFDVSHGDQNGLIMTFQRVIMEYKHKSRIIQS